ncbi:2-hydroxy-acid oxidase [Oribacterium sp. C9]|uniref:FAD-binding oxidoreductase n=1 Tax=Oribacterium sp. C9 TaxID=1943579 RepID=UPI0009901E19|nr:FAD-binding oxidoreductase [Oribacterium sp. C9]OON86712.1 2-hydroxy-acid oxidase [Oribacterium sp. C9]
MNYQKPSEEMIEELKKIAPGRVLTGEDIGDDYTHDESIFYGKHMPDVVVRVETNEEISEIVKLCYENNVPFVPRGAGTGLSAGCVAEAGGVIIDMTKMNKILGYDPDNFVVRVQSGITVQELCDDCEKHGFAYMGEPGEMMATIGGNISTNAGGMKAVKYGTTRDQVLAMTVITPKGDIMEFGREVNKNCSGYNFMHLMIGSEGTLGIITEVSLKLYVKPKFSVSLLAPFASLDDCISCVPKLKLAGFEPESLEFMLRDNVDMIQNFLGKKIYPTVIEGVEAEAYLLVTFTDSTQENLDTILEQSAEVFTDNEALDVMVYDTPDAIRNVWSVRKNCLEAIMAEYKMTDEVDIVVPIPKIPELINSAVAMKDEVGCDIRCTGHAGDGNVHINLCANEMPEDEFREKVKIFMDKVYKVGFELGGLVSGEHGIGSAKVDYLRENLGEHQLCLMKDVKRAFDPKLLLNPGKVCYTL